MRLRMVFALALLLGCTTPGFCADASPKPSSAPAPNPVIDKWCAELLAAMKSFHWQLEGCKFKGWKVGGTSVENRPLVYAEFGSPESKNTTLVFASVHGDEVTPLYIGISLVNWAAENEASLKDLHVVI